MLRVRRTRQTGTWRDLKSMFASGWGSNRPVRAGPGPLCLYCQRSALACCMRKAPLWRARPSTPPSKSTTISSLDMPNSRLSHRSRVASFERLGASPLSPISERRRDLPERSKGWWPYEGVQSAALFCMTCILRNGKADPPTDMCYTFVVMWHTDILPSTPQSIIRAVLRPCGARVRTSVLLCHDLREKSGESLSRLLAFLQKAVRNVGCRGFAADEGSSLYVPPRSCIEEGISVVIRSAAQPGWTSQMSGVVSCWC